MPTSSRTYTIFPGVPTVLESSTTVLGTETAGDPRALRRLVHPDSVNFPALVYEQNPDETTNLDNEILRHPITGLSRTLSSTIHFRYELFEEDVVCIESWLAGKKLSVPTWFFRSVYDYLDNPPAFSATDPQYIHWEPRDRNANVYLVEFHKLTVGRGGPGQEFKISEILPRGGAQIGSSGASLDVPASGVLVEPMHLHLKIVGQVIP